MSGYGFNLVEVKSDASLDPSLFDPSRTW
jgi:hypothetical protein